MCLYEVDASWWDVLSLSLKKTKKNSPPRSFCASFAQLSQASQNTERWAPVPAAPIRAALAGRCSRRHGN